MCYFVSSIQTTNGEPTFGHQTHKGLLRIVVEGIRTNMEAAQLCLCQLHSLLYLIGFLCPSMEQN